MIYWFIGIIAYILIEIFSYKKYISKWDVTKFEGVWFSFFWIALLPLYGVRKIQEIFQKL